MLGTPEMQKIYETNTMEAIDMSPEQFVQFIRDDVDHWARQLKAAGIKPD
jgi:tripartite-type tricarboxylate transporter receptor subunit TctC